MIDGGSDATPSKMRNAKANKGAGTMEMRTVHDPFTGADVQISDRLVDRLRGKYASGPHLPNGNPEFGWRQFQAPPIQHEAADRIDALEAALRKAQRAIAMILSEGGVITDGDNTPWWSGIIDAQQTIAATLRK